MKPSPNPLLSTLLLALTTACMGKPAPIALDGIEVAGEKVQSVYNDQNHVIVAEALTEILGRPVTPEEALLEMRYAEAYRIIHEWGLERDRERLSGLSGDEAEMLRRTIEAREWMVSHLTDVVIQEELRWTMPSEFDADADACEDTPAFLGVGTVQTIYRSAQSQTAMVFSTSGQATSRNAKREVGSNMTLRASPTGDTFYGTEARRTYHVCDFRLATVYDAMKLNLLHPDIGQWCVQLSGEHRAWNDAGEEVEEASQTPGGCEDIIGNDPTDAEDGISRRGGGQTGGGGSRARVDSD